MKKVVVGLIFSIFFGLNLFAEDYATIFSKACNNGEMEKCSHLGALYETGIGAKQDYFKANELYKKSCDAENARGCFRLGFNYHEGKGIKQDTKKAKELFGKACDLGLQEGCEGYAKLNKQ